MDANPFRSARAYLNYSPGAKWGALVCSALAPLCVALLFPLLFLFTDLLVSRGRVPEYGELPPARQAAFRDEWDAGLGGQDPAVHDAYTRLVAGRPETLTEDTVWATRWYAATHARFSIQVSPEAADLYIPLQPADPNYLQSPARQRLGVLSLVARERTAWPGSLVAGFARQNPWSWRPDASGSANVPYLTGLLALAVVLLLARGLLLNGAAYWSARATIEAANRLRRALYNHGYRLAAVAVKPDAQAEVGELVSRRVEQVEEGLLLWLTSAIRRPVMIVLLLALLLSVQPWLTVCLLLLGAAVWVVAGQAAAWYRRDARAADRRADARLDLMRESLSQVQLGKAYLMERFSQTRFERHLADLTRSVWRRRRGETFSKPTLLTIVCLVGLTMLYLAARVVLAGEMSPAGLAVKGAALATLLYAVSRWLTARARIARARGAAADVAEFLDRRADTGQPMDAEFLQPMSKKLEFQSVTLREPGTGRMLLEDVSLTIPAGTTAAVVFTDPDEAHALAHLITRFVDPTGGEIRIDGKNVRWVTFESVRTQVAPVLERSTTFTDTVANNIGCGDPGFSLPQIIEAAKVAHAHQFVQRLPYGYETLIGDGGVSLTPGQRYRIALARAILRDPSLLVIEEPAEPLDADSLVLIDDAVSRFQSARTVIFLARRPSTVRAADRVYVLQGGKIVAAGSHDELIAGSELYRALHFRQGLTAASP